MNPAAVLAAAAALQEFTLDQVAAYCNGDPDEVADVLNDAGRYVRPAGPRRWRVGNLPALRAELAGNARAHPPAVRRAPDPAALEARLVLAEETLVGCGAEPSSECRRLMATTVMNYLRQVITVEQPGRPEAWWEISLSELPSWAAGTSLPRIRTDVALARMTACEAAGQAMDVDFLHDTAVETNQLFDTGSVDRDRLARLVERLWDLSRELTTPAGDGDSARLLSAVAWRRAYVRAREDPPAVARELVGLLGGMACGPLRLSDEQQLPLFHVLSKVSPDRRRIVVYTDLLHLLPLHHQVSLEEQVLPGALVEAVTDTTTAHHLRDYASAIETDLAGSPFRSDSALIGQVVHVFEDLATQEATVDRSVVERGERKRTELLELAGVPV